MIIVKLLKLSRFKRVLKCSVYSALTRRGETRQMASGGSDRMPWRMKVSSASQ